MGKLAAFLAAVVVVGFAFWLTWTWNSPDGMSQNPSLGPEKETPPVSNQGDALQSPSTRVDELRAEVPGSDALELGPGSSTPTTPRGYLTILVLERGAGTPLEQVRVHVELERRDTHQILWAESEPAGLMELVMTTADGLASFEVPPDQELVVRVDGEDPKVGRLSQRVSPLQIDEQRDLTIELRVGPDIHFWGRAIASATGDPVIGAPVVIPDSNMPAETLTDSLGYFEVHHYSWRRSHAQIDAPGFGRALVVPTPGHENRAKAQVVHLLRSSSIQATITEAGIPAAGVSLHATTNFSYLIRPRGASNNTTGRHPVWNAESDATGKLEITGLPPGVPIEIELRRASEVLRKFPEPLQLREAERHVVTWALGNGGSIDGLALDENGSPVTNMDVWLRSSDGNLAQYFNRWDGEKASKKAVTDAEGRFTFDDVPTGTWLCGPAWKEIEDQHGGSDLVAPLAQLVLIEFPGQRIGLQLHVTRGLYIRGNVVDGQGEPYGGDWVRFKTERLRGVQDFRSSADGSFIAGPFAPGEYLVHAYGSGLSMNSEPVTASAGDRDLLLRLLPAAMIRGRVVDAETGLGCMAELRLISIDSPLGYERWNYSAAETGAFVQEELETGTYHLLARTDDGRIGLVRDLTVEVGRLLANIEVRVQRGAILEVHSGDGTESGFNLRHDGLGVGHGFIGEGKIARQTLFPGRTVVNYRAGGGGQIEVDVVAGETLELVLPPQK